ncbi:MAG: YCF48-related protein [Alphaproteobacteria bacterium]
MTKLYVGTAGMSVWFSDDAGAHWDRPYSESGLYLESRVWALASHPKAPGRVYAGTDRGLYRLDAAGKRRRWTHMPSPMDTLDIWALAVAPHDPKLLLAGTHPAGLYLSRDAGKSWKRLRCKFADHCIFIGKPRVTTVVFDPIDPNWMWAGVEIDGIYRSTNGGRTWTKHVNGLRTEDIHGLTVIEHDGRRRVLATLNAGLHISDDDGESWEWRKLPSKWQYTRTTLPINGGKRLLLTNGNGPPGNDGRLLKSDDGGESWSDAGLPTPVNSTPWCITADPDGKQIFVLSNLGQIFQSKNGGRTWKKLDRELGEIRSALLQAA